MDGIKSSVREREKKRIHWRKRGVIGRVGGERQEVRKKGER